MSSFSMPRSLRTKSVETLSPAHGDPSRTTPVTSSATALLSTMMGGGMLTIPFAYSQVGLLGGLILQLASASTY
jgi:amino acid permease